MTANTRLSELKIERHLMLKKKIAKAFVGVFALAASFSIIAAPAIAVSPSGDFSTSNSVIDTTGQLTKSEVDNIEKQAHGGNNKVISVYVTEDKNEKEIGRDSAEVFDKWNIGSKEALLYFNIDTLTYKWVIGDGAQDLLNSSERSKVHSRAANHFANGNVSSALGVMTSFAKYSITNPGMFSTNSEDAKKATSSKSPDIDGMKDNLNNFTKVAVSVLVGIAFLIIIIVVIVNVSRAKVAKAVQASKAAIDSGVASQKARLNQVAKVREDSFNKAVGIDESMFSSDEDSLDAELEEDLHEKDLVSEAWSVNNTPLSESLSNNKSFESKDTTDLFGSWDKGSIGNSNQPNKTESESKDDPKVSSAFEEVNKIKDKGTDDLFGSWGKF